MDRRVVTGPIGLATIDLARPFASVSGRPGDRRLQVLVRHGGRVLGWVELALNGDGSPVAPPLDRIAGSLGAALVRRLVEDRLLDGIPEAGLAARVLLEPPGSPVGGAPLVSVAVCTRERPDDLARCLEAIAALRYPAFEVLVVDNAPVTDRVANLVTQRFPAVRYLREPRRGLDWARNRAVLEARGELLAFADDDVVVDGDWLTALVRHFADDPAVLLVTGLVAPLELDTPSQVRFEQYGGFGKGFRRRWWRHRQAENGAPVTIHGAGQFGTGANMAFRRTAFDWIGRFDPALDVGTPTNGGGDLDLYFRVLLAGGTLVYDPDALVWHRHRQDRTALGRQLEGWGSGFWAFAIRSGLVFPAERPGFREVLRWWLRHWVAARLWRGLRRDRWILGPLAAEVRGAVKARASYRAAQRQVVATLAEHGPLGPPDPAPPPAVAPPADPVVGVRCLEVTKPLRHPLDGLGAFDQVRLYLLRGGTPVGFITIANHREPVPAARLRYLVAQALGEAVMDPSAGPPPLATGAGEVLAACVAAASSPVVAAPLPPLPPTVVSVVIATRDRPDDLRRCLASLVEQRTRHSLDIVVVDNGPAVGPTAEVVSAFPSVRLVAEPRPGLSFARNTGIRAARGEFVLATDDDVVASADWVERVVAPFADPTVAAVTGNVLPMELHTASQRHFEKYGGLGRGFERRRFTPEWFHGMRGRAVPTWEIGATANAAFRAGIFRDGRIGMLDERLGAGMPAGVGEDTYLFYRILKAGFSISYEPGAWVWHRHRRDAAALGRQLWAYSAGHVAYHLVTWLDEGDRRGLYQLFGTLPLWHARRLVRWIRGRREYPIRLIFTEIGGYLAGPWALWRSVRKVRRLQGRSGGASS